MLGAGAVIVSDGRLDQAGHLGAGVPEVFLDMGFLDLSGAGVPGAK